MRLLRLTSGPPAPCCTWRAGKATIQTRGRTIRIQTILQLKIEKSEFYPLGQMTALVKL